MRARTRHELSRSRFAERHAVRSAAAIGLCAWVGGVGVAQSTTGAFFPAQATITRIPYYSGNEIARGDLNGDGADDVVAANGLFTVGPNSMPFRGVLFNEDGSTYATVTPAVSPIPTYANGFRRTALADFDEDGRVDALSLTFPFELLFSRNEGQGKAVQGFPTHTVVASFASLLGLTFPNTNVDPLATVPVFVTGDFDLDGHADLLVGVTLIYGLFLGVPPAIGSGGLVFFFGNGDGTFSAPHLVPTADAPIDAEFVDWDGNGIGDTLLLLGHTAVVTTPIGQYQDYFTIYDVTTTASGGRTIAPRGASQWLGTSRYTSFAYIPDTASTPRVLAFAGHECALATTMRPQLWVTEVDAAGLVAGIPAPVGPAIVAIGNCDMQGIQVADFDLDGHLDVVGLVEGESTLSTPIQRTEICFVAGPFDATGAHGVMGSLTTTNTWSTTLNHPPMQGSGFIYSPNRGHPDVLQVVDLDSDGAPDIVASNMLRPSPTGTAEPVILSVVNSSPGALGLTTGNVRRLAFGTPDPTGRLARCGIQGGDPVLGNGAFRLSLRDAPASGIAALVAARTTSPHGTLGLAMALVPEFVGFVQPLTALQQGAGALEEYLPLPALPALLDPTAVFQWVILDSATGLLECSDAILVDFGP